MSSFKYTSHWTNPIVFSLASDVEGMSKAVAFRFMRDREKMLAYTIETSADCTAKYYILGDGEVVATADMYDNAALIAEAFASHSPYYSVVDVMSYEGLVCHYLSKDFCNDRRNHVS